MWFEHILERTDLYALQFFASLAGAILAVYVMQLVSRGTIFLGSGNIVGWIIRLAFGALALGFIWSLSYATHKGWQPWPPGLLILLAVDLLLGAIVAGSFQKAELNKNLA